MTDQTEPLSADALRRRSFIRGGALVAAAGAGAVVAGAASALPAQAANGDAVTVGGTFAGTTTTTLTSSSATAAALTLANSNGPTLKLQPAASTFDPSSLKVGEIANSTLGPYVGIDNGSGGATGTTLATGEDLAQIPLPYVAAPSRVLSTLSAAGRTNILSQSGKLDSTGRLKAGQYIDVRILSTEEEVTLQGFFFNMTVTKATGSGYVVAYPPTSPRPNASTISYVEGTTLSNGGLVAVDQVGSAFVVRLYTTTTVHIILDVSGYVATRVPPGTANSTSAASVQRNQARGGASRRFQRVLGARR